MSLKVRKVATIRNQYNQVPRPTVLILGNSADTDEMQHYAAFHLGLHCLPKYLFMGFQYTQGYTGLRKLIQ